jgi:signal transduction histidine kinase
MIADIVTNNWRDIKKYRYLIVASAAIIAAIFALLLMQYRSVKRTQEHAQKTMMANLELHLFEISEEAKRGILDHANHIMHGVRQQRVRDRNIPSIERAYTRQARRYPEVEDFYVVFFERGQEAETWQALKFVRPDPNDPNVQTYEGAPVGSLVEDAAVSQSIRRAWQSIQKESQTALYAAYDPEIINDRPRQYFFHTVYELDRLKRRAPLENIGLLVFSANAEKFPSPDYLKKLVAKHQERDKQVNGLTGKLNYTITLNAGDETRELAATDGSPSAALARRFSDSDRLFPNLTFGVSAPDIEARTYAAEYIQSSLLLGLGAALVAIVGLLLTWRATRREMQVAQIKSDFLASISHELKTPLTAIRAFGDLLHSGRASRPERIREYGGIIKTESDRLTALINNILEMSRLERGVRKYRLETGDLRAAVAETVEVFRHSPEAAKFDLAVKLPLHPVETKFDEGAIRQALINLFANAVKYSSGGEKDSRVEIGLQSAGGEAIIEVRDFGVGIAKEDQRDIFTPFHRAATDEIQAKGGTGLGLAIVREIARGHGGDVSVESERGKGSVFRLHLPLLSEAAQEDFQEEKDGAYFGYRGRAKRSYRPAR